VDVTAGVGELPAKVISLAVGLPVTVWAMYNIFPPVKEIFDVCIAFVSWSFSR